MPERESQRNRQPPGPVLALIVMVVSVGVIAVTAALATSPGAEEAQTGFVVRVNDPPGVMGTLMAVVNPLLRPVPLVIVGAVLAVWVIVTTGRDRVEVLRDLVVAVLVAELVDQVLKRLAAQPRPTEVISGLDSHGYPREPAGNAFPSAHTAIVVAAVSAAWPWLNRTQRAVAIVLTIVVPLNRIYIGAHWPVDIIGGAAVGLAAGALSWLAAHRWPITPRPRDRHPPRGGAQPQQRGDGQVRGGDGFAPGAAGGSTRSSAAVSACALAMTEAHP